MKDYLSKNPLFLKQTFLPLHVVLITEWLAFVSFTVRRPHYIFVPHERVIIFIFCHFFHYFMLTSIWRKDIYLSHNERRHAFNLSSSRLIERWPIEGGMSPPFWILYRGEGWGILEGRGRYANLRHQNKDETFWLARGLPPTQKHLHVIIHSHLIGRHLTWPSYSFIFSSRMCTSSKVRPRQRGYI